MIVRRLDTTKAGDVRKFVQLPFDLYKDCANWCPPLRNDIKAVMNKHKHPLYRTSAADFFVA